GGAGTAHGPPRPAAGPRGEGGNARRPAPPVSRAELAPAFVQVSPPSFEWPRGRARTSIGTGRDTLPGTAAPLGGGGPPESAWVLGAARPWPWGQGPRLLPMTSRGAAGPPSPPLLAPPDPGPKSLTPPPPA